MDEFAGRGIEHQDGGAADCNEPAIWRERDADGLLEALRGEEDFPGRRLIDAGAFPHESERASLSLDWRHLHYSAAEQPPVG
jgi:hypothetical protein